MYMKNDRQQFSVTADDFTSGCMASCVAWRAYRLVTGSVGGGAKYPRLNITVLLLKWSARDCTQRLSLYCVGRWNAFARDLEYCCAPLGL